MNDDLLFEMMLRSGLLQYPDAKLYNAAKLLAPEERPTVPVKVAKDKWREQRGAAATFLPSHAPTEQGAPEPGRAYVRVQKNSEAYNKPHRLAAILAHEAVHARRNDDDEKEAYGKQAEVLQRLGEKDKEMLDILLERAATGTIVKRTR